MFRANKRSNKAQRYSKEQKAKNYRHIVVTDNIDRLRRTRTIAVTCPLEYPGMTERERRRMYEGLSMVADAFRDADKRCEALHG